MTDGVSITDPDLVARLAAVEGLPGYDGVLFGAQKVQAERNRERGLTPVKRRRAQTARALKEQRFTDEDCHHIHSVLALCGLPYRRPPDGTRDFLQEYGRNSLVVTSGFLKNPVTGRMEPQGLPYGPKARLLLLHICSMAIRQKSAEIEIADSMTAFIRELGFAVTGGSRGTLGQFKEQLNRLAAARMQLGLWQGTQTSTINAQPIEAFNIWLPSNPDQQVLWSSTLRLDERFYRSLTTHALPVDIRILRAFSQSARQMDIVLWLGYRLRNLKRSYPIRWATLHAQFGSGVTSLRKFRQSFAADLKVIEEVIPTLPVRLTETGLLLMPCDAEKLFVPTRRSRLG